MSLAVDIFLGTKIATAIGCCYFINRRVEGGDVFFSFSLDINHNGLNCTNPKKIHPLHPDPGPLPPSSFLADFRF